MSELIQTRIEGTVFHLALRMSRMDARCAAQLKEETRAAWQPNMTSVEVDMTPVQFIDSSGIGVLLNIYRWLPEGDAHVALLNVQPAVQSVIELLRLHRIFRVEG